MKKTFTGNYLWIFALVLAILVAVTDVLLLARIEKDCEEKNAIVLQLTAAPNPVAGAADLLKSGWDEKQQEEGRRLLEPLGFDDSYGMVFRKEAARQKAAVMLSSVAIYVMVVLLMLAFRIKMKQQQQQQLEYIQQVLDNFQNKTYEMPSYNYSEGAESRLYMRLSSLGNQIKLHDSQIKKEKEETKALVTDISHQLKTPVAALKTCFDLLQEDSLSKAEKEEFKNRCDHQLQGLEQLTQALINISRMETGMIAIVKEEKSIFETILRAVNRVFLKAEEKQITMEMEENAALQNLKLYYDEKWTQEAIINILENAVKYSEAGSVIQIRMQKLTSFLHLEIEDQGVGIAKEEYPYIFQRFYRGKSNWVKEAEGSGIGLYLTREIMERQGGSIIVSSKTGTQNHGSTFILQFPLQSLTKL